MYFTREQMPPPFPVDHPGRLERVTYESVTYDGENRALRKDALVYLPAGYDSQPDRRYPVFYLMHGGGGNADTMFGGLDPKSELKAILDQAIASGRAQPMIVVTPTYFICGHEEAHRDVQEAAQLTHRFPQEMKNDLIPFIDRTYRTLPDRRSRAFGGFSMGAEATWSVLAGCSRDVAVFLPMSGDYWACGVKGSKEHPARTVDLLIDRIRSCCTAPGDYRILAFTGTRDIAFEAMDPMVHEMEKRQPWFVPGSSLTYCLKPEGFHTGEACLEYVSLALPMLFPAP